MLDIAICDDNKEYVHLMSECINESISEMALPFKIACTVATPFKLEEYLKANSVNIFFLDINSDNKADGLELAARIREYDSTSYIIFISEFQEYAYQAFRVHPFEFIKKPASKEEIKNCLRSVYQDYIIRHGTSDSSTKLYIKSGTATYVLRKTEIILIERLLGKTIIHTPSKQVSCYNTLEYFEKMFASDEEFIRCHKSYIANRNHISEIRYNTKELIMSTGHKCCVGKKYKGDL